MSAGSRAMQSGAGFFPLELVPVRGDSGASLAEIGLRSLADIGWPGRRLGGSCLGRYRLTARVEYRHDGIERRGLGLGLLDGSIGLFHQGCIVLGHLVHG